MSPAKTSLEKKRCKLMTNPRRYGGKSHPATPTQEQTRPISTETSNLVEKYCCFWFCCVNGHCRNKTLQIDDQTAQICGNLIPATPTQEQTRQWRRKLAIYTKNILFLISPTKTSLEKNKRLQVDDQTAQIWWKSHPATPTQEQTRPISTETSNLYEKYAVFDVSCKNERWKNKRCSWWPKPRRYGGESHPADPNSGADETNDDGS